MKPVIYTRGQALPDLLAQRIVILDGAMGTMIQRFKLVEADYRGERLREHPLISEVVTTDTVPAPDDWPELQVRSWCWSPLYVHPTAGLDYGDLLKVALRMSPDRIVIGESRGGSIVQLFDALLSGHPGGISTFHADNVRQAFLRMLNYARRDSDTDSHRHTIGDAIDLLVVLRKDGPLRRVTEMVRVLGFSDEAGDYVTEAVR